MPGSRYYQSYIRTRRAGQETPPHLILPRRLAGEGDREAVEGAGAARPRAAAMGRRQRRREFPPRVEAPARDSGAAERYGALRAGLEAVARRG
ncbi:MAG: hypothetical protein ABI906_09520 [Pseudomonadota bacterium]